MKSFRAYGNAGHVTCDTPRSAAEKYFKDFPSSRKCSIVEGEFDGNFFTVAYGRTSEGKWPYQAKDVTKKRLTSLPNTNSVTEAA